VPKLRICRDIDLKRSLQLVFGEREGAKNEIRDDSERQLKTAGSILRRFFRPDDTFRREIVMLADEVGLGKTFVALTVAVSLLDAIRRDEGPEELPSNQPVILVLTPNNDALYNKWRREAETFQKECAKTRHALDWYGVESPHNDLSRSGNVIDLTKQIRRATTSHPLIVVAKLGVFGSRLPDQWRRNALACVFQEFNVCSSQRVTICREVLGSGSQAYVPELLDMRLSGWLWDGEDCAGLSANLRLAYSRAVRVPQLHKKIHQAIANDDSGRLTDLMDRLTRSALVWDWPILPLVIVDEVHHLKNEHTQARKNLERYLQERACRVLGLSATPFQLHHEELLRVLGLHRLAKMPSARRQALQTSITELEEAMKRARRDGERFRQAWSGLMPKDRDAIYTIWARTESSLRSKGSSILDGVRPDRVITASEKARFLEHSNRNLEKELRPFVIRHRHDRSYRAYWVGRNAEPENSVGSSHFDWAPGMEVPASAELVHYLLMRAVSLAKNEKGRAGLGAELTGSYRHLVETSATWKRFGNASNPQLFAYKNALERDIARKDADATHPKIQATVRRALKAFREGQKTLIFCVYVKTAEAVRDQLLQHVQQELATRREKVFGSEGKFEGFRKRFFNRHEPLYSLIQDHPLIGVMPDSKVGIPPELRMGEAELRQVAEIVASRAKPGSVEKPDRRLLLSVVENVAVRAWEASAKGVDWLDRVLPRESLGELREAIARSNWIPGRPLLSGSSAARDPEAGRGATDPLAPENAEIGHPWREASRTANAELWHKRLQRGSWADVIAPYFRQEVVSFGSRRVPTLLLPQFHSDMLVKLDVESRRTAGLVFRRALMAEEFLIRYLTDAPRGSELWSEYLANRYNERLGHNESLLDRMRAYFESLVRAVPNEMLKQGYLEAATNLNVVQLVKGGMNSDRYFLGFNTPYRPEILVATSVGQEGIDLHRECRQIIHHDLCWSPAMIEQRTGRIDRIGSKVERERAGAPTGAKPSLDVAVPYLAATYDERMFEELHRRAEFFEVTMGGDLRVDGRVTDEERLRHTRNRKNLGIGTLEEDLGEESETKTIDLPPGMVEKLRINLSVWSRGERR
jgi:hypothetical protein